MPGPSLNGSNVDQIIRGKDLTLVRPVTEEALSRVAAATAVLPTLATEATLRKVLDALQTGK